MILKTNSKSERTGQKSSDDEVSEFVIPSRKEVIFEIKSLNALPLCKRMLITAMEVTLFGPVFHKD